MTTVCQGWHNTYVVCQDMIFTLPVCVLLVVKHCCLLLTIHKLLSG